MVSIRKFNPLYCQNPLLANSTMFPLLLTSITCKFNPLYCQNPLLAISAPPYARQRRHSKMAVSRRLGYCRTGVIRSADPENPCLEPHMEWIGCTVCEIFAFKVYCDLETRVRGHSKSSKAAPLDRPISKN